MTFPYIGQLLAGYHLNFSPKVVVPGFVGLTIFSIACELRHYGFTNVDLGTIAFVVIQVMIFLGWLVPDPARTAARNEVSDLLSNAK